MVGLLHFSRYSLAVSLQQNAADFCHTITPDCSDVSCSLNIRQTSRGKTLNFHRVNAQFIKRIPIADGELNGHVPTGSRYVTPHIGFLFVAPRFRLKRLLLVPFR